MSYAFPIILELLLLLVVDINLVYAKVSDLHFLLLNYLTSGSTFRFWRRLTHFFLHAVVIHLS